MKAHLFATDRSALQLIDLLPPEIELSALVVPQNRSGQDKVHALIAESDGSLAIFEHMRGEALPGKLPPADIGISWMYSQLFKAKDIKRYSAGILNMHGGALPEYRGSNVLQWAIINGESELGVTWHSIIEEVDAGPVWAESRIPISLWATAADLRQDMIEDGLALFPEAAKLWHGGSSPIRSLTTGDGRIWPGRRPEDGQIGPGLTETQVCDMVRALCPPWPPATVEVDGEWRPVAAVKTSETVGSIRYLSSDSQELFLELDTS